MKTLMGLDHALVIEYGARHLASLLPDNEVAFVREIEKRLDKIENELDKLK